MAIHVCAYDIHLIGVRAADLGAVDLLPLAGCAWLRIQCSQLGVGLALWILIHSGRSVLPAEAAASLRRASRHRRPAGPWLLLRRVGVAQSGDVPAAIGAQLRFDPIDRSAIAVGALATVTKACESLDRRLVALQIQTGYERRGRVVRSGCGRGGLGRRERVRSQRGERGERTQRDDSR